MEEKRMKTLVFVIFIVVLFANYTFAQNLVYNGSFEQGTSGWTYVSYKGIWAVGESTPDYFGPPIASSGTEGYWNPGSNPNGNNVLHISQNNYWTKEHWAYQEVATQTGVTYIFRAMFSGGAGPATLGYNQEEDLMAYWDLGIYRGPYENTIEARQGSSRVDYRYMVTSNPGSINGSFGWIVATANFTAVSETSTIYLGWDAQAHTSPSKLRKIPFGAYFDSVELVPVPEPSSLLALCGGVTGILALRRRHK